MMSAAKDDSAREEHNRLGRQLFNSTWELIDKPDRSPDDDVEMLLRATASRYHWGQIGGPEEVASGDWQVAHVACLVGLADLAQRFAARSLATATAEGWRGWRLASAHEGMARACAAAGDSLGRSRHVAAAEAALAEEADEEDREIVASQLASIPDV
jgi:hypothetical protein